MTLRISRRAIVSLLISTILALVMVELFARHRATRVVEEKVKSGTVEAFSQEIQFDTPGGPRLAPNANVTVKNHPLANADIVIKTNEFGFRDDPLAAVKPSNERRVLVIGDSITFGDAVDANQAWVDLTEKRVNAAGGPVHYQFINAGVSGMGLAEEVNLLEETGDRAQIDAIILGFYLNDSRPNGGFRGEIAYHSWLRRHSAAWDQIVRLNAFKKWRKKQGVDLFSWIDRAQNFKWMKDREEFVHVVEAARFDWGSAWYPEAWQTMAPDFDRLQQYAEKRHLPVLMLVFPVTLQIASSVGDTWPQEQARNAANARHFRFFDVLSVLKPGGPRMTDDLYFDHCHLKPLGNQLVAAALSEFLLAKPLVQ